MFPDIQGVKNGNIGLACIKLLISVKVLSGLLLVQPKAYLELCQKSKMKCFAKIVNDFYSLTIFAKHFILEVWQVIRRTSMIKV